MEIRFNPKTGLPEIVNDDLTNDDLTDARHIKEMLKSKGWLALNKYQLVGRESVIDAIKDCIRSRAKKELAPERAAVLKGWDECVMLAERITKRAEIYLKNKKKEPEVPVYDPNDEGQ